MIVNLVRVTEALDFFQTSDLVEWRTRVGNAEANRVCNKALKIGTRLHEIIASGTFDAAAKDKPEVKNCLAGFLAWMDRYQVLNDELVTCTRLNDEVIGLTGEPDMIWIKQNVLIDLKTSASIRPTHFFQLGGYHRLGVKADKLAILRLDKEIPGHFEYKTNDDMGISIETCVDAFESAFKHYRYYTHIDAVLKGGISVNSSST